MHVVLDVMQLNITPSIIHVILMPKNFKSQLFEQLGKNTYLSLPNR